MWLHRPARARRPSTEVITAATARICSDQTFSWKRFRRSTFSHVITYIVQAGKPFGTKLTNTKDKFDGPSFFELKRATCAAFSLTYPETSRLINAGKHPMATDGGDSLLDRCRVGAATRQLYIKNKLHRDPLRRLAPAVPSCTPTVGRDRGYNRKGHGGGSSCSYQTSRGAW